ncbi:DUF3558 domain-containing protein [Amycolatopsis panacis]|uniref:DUF3558 domain-containing protein n=1 Tax=Amycolatopsis panacis TaxID=2340917 RepID=A0A419I2R8_9PSEU|nr:DUF3558 domain-containing protein [Amycolatopsis panacis]RJQ84342.1 DUF3558 domain-containing protein [Amycolatopsis panacis]
MTKPIARTIATGLLLITATACSPTPGTPSPAPSSSAPLSTGPPLPQVASPLNVTRYEQDPCSALSPAQATEFIGATRSSKDPSSIAPICTWFDRHNSGVSLGFLPGQGGLATTYKNSVGSTTGYFQGTPDVSGYPAVFSAVHDDRDDGGCQIAVGVTNGEVFTVGSVLNKNSPSYSDPCSLVRKVAEAAVTTIKAGA